MQGTEPEPRFRLGLRELGTGAVSILAALRAAWKTSQGDVEGLLSVWLLSLIGVTAAGTMLVFAVRPRPYADDPSGRESDGAATSFCWVLLASAHVLLLFRFLPIFYNFGLRLNALTLAVVWPYTPHVLVAAGAVCAAAIRLCDTRESRRRARRVTTVMWFAVLIAILAALFWPLLSLLGTLG